MAEEHPDKNRILSYVNGLLYFYGVMVFETLYRLVCENLSISLDRETFEIVLNEGAHGEDISYDFVLDEGFFICLGVEEPEEILEEQEKRPEIPYRPVTEKEARLVTEEKFTSLWGEAANRLCRQLQENHGWPREEAVDMVLYAQDMHQNGVPTNKLVEEFLGEMEFEGLDEVQPFIDLIMGMVNDTPLWVLKGWTPKEVFERHEKHRLQPLPDKPFEEREGKGKGSDTKVGRNEPCSCGSGRKFKKCCGAPVQTEAEEMPPSPQREVEDHVEPTLEEWKALYEAAQAFKEARCWEWMYNDDLFGVQDPETGEIAYCCVMGCTDELYGLGAYLGTEGLEALMGMMSDSTAEDSPDLLYLQKCLLATFENREILEDSDRAVIKKLGLKFRGKNQWPMFRSYQPGLYPWFLNAWECRFLTLVLQQALEVCWRCREEKSLLERSGEDGVLIRVPQKEGAQAGWIDRYRKLPALEKHYLSVNITDELYLRRVVASIKETRGTWEVDTFWLPFPIQEHKSVRPYFSKAFTILDRSSGLILRQELMKDLQQEASRCIEALTQLISSQNWAPSRIAVERDETYYLLLESCRQLEIPLEKVERLQLLPELREKMRRGRPGG